MRKTVILIALFISIKIFSQNGETVNLSKINFYELSIGDTKYQVTNLKEEKLYEMNYSNNVFREDNKFLNRTGFENKLYPGVVFQKCTVDDKIETKINTLYIVDGKVATEQFIRDLKPEDIDSITILKDNSTTNKFENGVVVVKLKKK